MTAEKKYHVNPETGESNPCDATVRDCKFGVSNHYDTQQDAEAAGQKILQDKHGLVPILKKSKQKTYTSFQELAKSCLMNTDDAVRRVEGLCNEREQKEERWNNWYAKKRLKRREKWEKKLAENPQWATTPVPDAPKKVKVYRAGKVVPSEYKDDVAVYSDYADQYAPEGCASRNHGIFASTTGKSLRRWLYANYDTYDHSRGEDSYEPHEIEVDPNKTYVYSISAWEDYSWHGAPPEHYWNSRILLSRFEEVKGQEGFEPEEWEIVISPEQVIRSKPMSSPAVMKLMENEEMEEYERDKVSHIMKRVNRWRRANKIAAQKDDSHA